MLTNFDNSVVYNKEKYYNIMNNFWTKKSVFILSCNVFVGHIFILKKQGIG